MTEALDKGCIDGTIVGQGTTSLVGFWGVTPVAQTSALTAATTALTVASASASLSTTIHMTVGASSWGFTNTKEAQAVMKAIQTLQVRQKEVSNKLEACGLVSGGTQIADADLKGYDTIGTGEDDGAVLGAATSDKVAFWGMAPTAQVSAFSAAVTVTTMPIIVVTVTASQILAASGVVSIMVQESATAYGFDTFNAGQTFLQVVAGLESRLAEVDSRMQSLGIMTGGTAKTAATKYDYLDKNNDDGTMLIARPTSKLGFWAATPVVRPAALTTAAVTIVASIYATGTDTTVAALTSTTDSFFFTGVTTTQVLLDAVRRLQIRMGEIEALFDQTGLVADDSVSGS